MATSHGLSDDERGPARERHDVGHAATRVFRGCARAVHRLYPVPNFKPVRSRAPRSSLGAPRGSQFHLSVKQCCDTPSREQTYYSNSCFDRDRGTDCPPARAGGGAVRFLCAFAFFPLAGKKHGARVLAAPPARRFRRAFGRDVDPPATTEATWLILPVVIRLSQRLSHACLSISESETANGSLYQL